MKFTKEQKKEILEIYLKWVDEVCENIEWKTHFTPEEIIYKVVQIIEERFIDE